LFYHFVSTAAGAGRNRYPILPCACVGTEDMLDILFDLPLSFLKGISPVSALPVAAPNSLQKIYFWFGKPIPTEKYQGLVSPSMSMFGHTRLHVGPGKHFQPESEMFSQ